VSRISLLILLLFGIAVIGLAFIGILRIFNQDSLTRELTSLQKSNIILQNVLSDVEYSSILDSSGSYEEFIADFYSRHPTLYPDVAPVKGYVTRGLNLETNHYGIDIAAKFQDEVQAPSNGRVVFSGMSEDLGNTIIMNHPGGIPKIFTHAGKNDSPIAGSLNFILEFRCDINTIMICL
jgi:murein DD-endopeptidase MepM/ murein hydrolase activator NlpD